MKQQQSLIGTWVTRDGYIRQELLPGGRYHKQKVRGGELLNFTGNYTLRGNRIRYTDDNGHEVSADYLNGMLYCKGYVFYKDEPSYSMVRRTQEEAIML